MGRKSLPTKLIPDLSRRIAGFRQRKRGLLKKAMELSILCGCEITLTIHNADETEPSHEWMEYRSAKNIIDHLNKAPRCFTNEDYARVFPTLYDAADDGDDHSGHSDDHSDEPQHVPSKVNAARAGGGTCCCPDTCCCGEPASAYNSNIIAEATPATPPEHPINTLSMVAAPAKPPVQQRQSSPPLKTAAAPKRKAPEGTLKRRQPAQTANLQQQVAYQVAHQQVAHLQLSPPLTPQSSFIIPQQMMQQQHVSRLAQVLLPRQPQQYMRVEDKRQQLTLTEILIPDHLSVTESMTVEPLSKRQRMPERSPAEALVMMNASPMFHAA